MALIPRFGYGERTSFLASLTLGQISEFSFIVAALALAAGLVDEAFLSLIGVVGLVTMGTSPRADPERATGSTAAPGRGLLALFRASRAPRPARSRSSWRTTSSWSG
jgi:Kef-type K+ transport system membrane component KefB